MTDVAPADPPRGRDRATAFHLVVFAIAATILVVGISVGSHRLLDPQYLLWAGLIA